MASVDLSSSSINLQKVRDDAAGNLINALESRAGRKALVLDPKLGPPLMSLVNMQTLKGLEVDKLYYLQGGTLETSCQEVVFIIRPRLELMHKLAEVVLGIREDINSHNQHANANVAAGNRPGNRTLLRTKKRMPTFTVFTVPRTSDACATILKHLGVYEHLVMRKLEIDAVPVERDVFLVEHGNAWRDLAVERVRVARFPNSASLCSHTRLKLFFYNTGHQLAFRHRASVARASTKNRRNPSRVWQRNRGERGCGDYGALATGTVRGEGKG